MKYFYPFLIGSIFCASLSGQDGKTKGSILPIWMPADSTVIILDTLAITHSKTSLSVNRSELLIGVGIVLISGAAAWQYHSQAEAAYRDYLAEGDISKINAHYDKAEKFDRYTGTAYLGIQIGFLILLKAVFP